MRYLLTLQYQGTRYAGWQRQANAVAVQQVVEEALEKMFGARVIIEGAGRTDSGVHARAQRAHADLPREMEPRGLMLGLNDLLPHDIRVTAVERSADDFHCRFAAKSKTYVYQIWNGPVADVFAYETQAYVAQHLDESLMRAAAQSLVGKHDFRAFTVIAPEVSSTCRTVEAVDVQRDADVVRLTLTADGFLRYMVRRIAGSLIEIGRGKLTADALAAALEPTFAEARWTAPSKGLVLWDIAY
jgi:tRNA pseudouridine38-40 synthase